MKLESQVTNIDLSKRLRELGANQKSSFHWWLNVDPLNFDPDEWMVAYGSPKNGRTAEIAAFTVAELGVALPTTIDDGGTAFLRIEKGWVVVPETQWSVSYQRGGPVRAFQWLDSLAEAMGKMLIHLLENKLITVEEVNARLEAA